MTFLMEKVSRLTILHVFLGKTVTYPCFTPYAFFSCYFSTWEGLVVTSMSVKKSSLSIRRAFFRNSAQDSLGDKSSGRQKPF